MNVIVYHGSSAAREVIRKYEWSYLDAKVRACVVANAVGDGHQTAGD
jgi:hypothetical protein